MRSLVLIVCLLAACSDSAGSQNPDPSGVVMISEDDAEMDAAITHARATLDEFLSVMSRPPKGASGFKLKVELSDSNGTEHFWVEPFSKTATGFEGTLANDPEIVANVKLGQKIAFTRDQVSDWGYVLGGKQIGSFTVCVMMKHVPVEEADIYRKDYGFVC